MRAAAGGNAGVARTRAGHIALGLILILSVACDDGRAPAVDATTDGAGADAGANVDGTAPDAGADAAMPMPCAANGPELGIVCSGYCSNLATACTGTNSQFTSPAACIATCTAPTWSCGTPTDPTGNTLFCRVTHAMAAMTAPDTECAQAGPDSASCI